MTFLLEYSIDFVFRFTVTFGNLEVFCNDNYTRTFIGLLAQPPDNLSQCVNQLDNVLSDYNLSKYYEVSVIRLTLYLFMSLKTFKLNITLPIWFMCVNLEVFQQFYFT